MRAHCGLKQSQLAAKTGISKSAISRFETGEQQIARRLCQRVNLRWIWLRRWCVSSPWSKLTKTPAASYTPEADRLEKSAFQRRPQLERKRLELVALRADGRCIRRNINPSETS